MAASILNSNTRLASIQTQNRLYSACKKDHSVKSMKIPGLSLSVSLPRSKNLFGIYSHIVICIPVIIYDLKMTSLFLLWVQDT
jgi:hypothetical protein